MQLSIIVFGILITALALVLLLSPARFSEFMLRHSGDHWFHVLAASFRIVLGIVLILYADESRFPAVLTVLGWIALIAGVILALIPRHRFKQLVNWAIERFGSYLRFASVAAALGGLFLVYAVV